MISLSFGAYSQNEWTLERCIQYALENNIQIKSQELNNQINENQLLQSKLGIMPSLNAGASEGLTFGRSVDQYTNEFSTENFNSTNFQISSSVVLFNGLQQYNTVKKSEIEKKSGILLLEKVKNDISLAIASAYLNVLFSQDLLDAANQQRDITEQQLDRTKKLVASGSLPLQNEYELEAQLASEELNIVNYENQLNISILVLTQILDLNVESLENFSIVRPIIEDITTESTLLSVDQIYQEAQTKMPQIENAELKYQSAEKSLAIARGALMPRLTMSAGYGTGYSSARKTIDNISPGSPIISGFTTDNSGNILDVYQYTFDYTYKNRSFNNQLRDNASASLTFNLNIPIFNGLQAKTQINNSKIYLEQSKFQIDQTKKDLLKEIQQAHSDAQSAMKKYFATEKTLNAIELSFDYTEKRFEQGLLNTTEYNIAKNNLAKTQIDLLKSKYDFIFKQKILDFYRGLGIKL